MLHMISLLANAKVDYAKFQAFKSSKLNKNYPDYALNYEYYKKLELTEEDYDYIIFNCNFYGIKPLFTVFDTDSARELYNKGVEQVKIASPDADNWELIDLCLELFKELFISTGMISDDNLKILKGKIAHSNAHVDLFYCISKYPTLYKDIDFNKMKHFDGFSDHTPDTRASKKAIDMGIKYIEKHFTLGKDLPGRDHHMSMLLKDFKDLVEHREYIEKIKNYKLRWKG